jgi:hypothetical protein
LGSAEYANSREEGNHSDLGLGRNISPSELDMMNDQQLGQLLELKTETSKPTGETDSFV